MNNMRMMFIGGEHPRHLYYINKIQDNFDHPNLVYIF